MPAPPAPTISNNLVRFVIETVTDGQFCQNVFDYKDDRILAISGADLLLAVTSWWGNHATDYRGCITGDTTVSAVYAMELHFGTTPTQVYNPAGPPVGSVAGHALPLEMAATLSRYSDLKGKHGRGRTSMPAVPIGFTTPATSPNVLNATGVTAYDTFGTGVAVAESLLGHSYTPVISTRPEAPDTLITNAAAIERYVTRATLGTARRRKIGRGI